MAVIEIDVNDFLALTQGETNNPSGEFVQDFLTFTEVVRVSHQFNLATNTLFINEIVQVDRSLTNISILQSLGLQQKASKGYHEFITQIIAMWDSSRPVFQEFVTQNLGLFESIAFETAKNGACTLIMTQAATVISVRPRTLIDTLTMNSRANGYISREDFYAIALPSLTGPNAPEC